MSQEIKEGSVRIKWRYWGPNAGPKPYGHGEWFPPDAHPFTSDYLYALNGLNDRISYSLETYKKEVAQ